MSAARSGTDALAVAPSAGRLRTVLVYAGLLALAAAAFLLIRGCGESVNAPVAASPASLAGTAPTPAADVLLHVLIALAAVLAVGAVLARLFARLGQPPVIGEVVAGLLLGPSLIGTHFSALILPPAIAPYLGIVAQLGVILYMFIIGLELNAGLLRGRVHAAVTIAQASIVVPFVLGALLALVLYPRLSNAGVPFTSFALFMGVAVSITAFPVLARILADRGLHKTELGVLALGCAAANDATAWCLLALAVGVVQAESGSGWGDGLRVILGAGVYIAAMLALVRPLLRRALRRWNGEPGRGATALAFLGLVLSALATQAIGLHALFGAFLFGVVIPHDSALARSFTQKLEPVVTVFLLPAFFAFTGMQTRLDLLNGADQWLLCALIVTVATLGKFGGTYAAARLSGLIARESAALGALMNTRGLIELIVLNVGLSLGVISPTLYAMMVVMALVTTMATGPALRLILRRRF